MTSFESDDSPEAFVMRVRNVLSICSRIYRLQDEQKDKERCATQMRENVARHKIQGEEHEPDNDEASGSEKNGLLASCTTEDQHDQVAFMGISQVHNSPCNYDSKYKTLKKAYDDMKPKYNTSFIEAATYKEAVKTLEQQKMWFQKNQLAYEEKIRVLERDLKCANDELTWTKKVNVKLDLEKQEMKDKLDKEIALHKNWLISRDNLASHLYGSQAVNSCIGLGFKKYVGLEARNDMGKSTPAGLATYVKEGKLHAVPGPIRGEFMPSSPQKDFDGSHHLYGKKSSDLPDPDCKSTDYNSCDSSDKSSKVNVSAPSVFNVKSSESISTESTSFTSTSSVSTSKSKVEIESKVRAPKQEPIVVQDLSSFTYNKPDKKTYTSRISCNKNGCFNKKAGNVKKKTCFVCGSKSHLIKDCDFHEKRIGVCADQKRSRPQWTSVNAIPSYVPPRATHVKTSRPNPADKSVPAGKPVSAERSFPAGWKRHVARPFYVPTSTYFQNGLWPSYFDPLYMGWGTRWDNGVKPSTGCSWTQKRKGSYWVPKNNSPCQVH